MRDTARAGLPAGYVRLGAPGVDAVGRATLAAPLAAALRAGSFYAYAARHPDARPMAGRGIVYAVPLPGDAARVVVRRSRHGGLLAPLTGDRFVGRTRAPRELEASLALSSAGVPTPELVAYATYRAAAALRRADVVTREIPHARDLTAVWADAGADDRRAALDAAAELVAALTRAGARHPDLNLKNVLLAPDGPALRAFVLDVDRVTFHAPGDPRVLERNVARLARSARRWRERRGLAIDDADIARLAAAARARLAR